MTTRRAGLKAAGLALTLAAFAAFAPPALSQDAAPSELAQAGPLGDVWLGDKDAKVTVIEYASMTCSHCASFHQNTWPAFKERYVDTGKVRFALREFPLDPLATAAFMLARCDGDSRYYPVTDMLFDKQQAWAFQQRPIDALEEMMRQAGFSKEKFEGCLKKQELFSGVNAVKSRAAERFKIDSTPTFFVNGQRLKGGVSIDDLAKAIDPLLAK